MQLARPKGEGEQTSSVVNQGVTKDIHRYIDSRKRLFLFRLGIEPVGIIAHKCTSIFSDKSQRKRR